MNALKTESMTTMRMKALIDELLYSIIAVEWEYKEVDLHWDYGFNRLSPEVRVRFAITYHRPRKHTQRETHLFSVHGKQRFSEWLAEIFVTWLGPEAFDPPFRVESVAIPYLQKKALVLALSQELESFFRPLFRQPEFRHEIQGLHSL